MNSKEIQLLGKPRGVTTRILCTVKMLGYYPIDHWGLFYILHLSIFGYSTQKSIENMQKSLCNVKCRV